MRLNNLSARLLCNEWLALNGFDPLSPSLSYEEFATKLRELTAKTLVQVKFVSRPDAVSYIRNFAKSKTSEMKGVAQ